MVLRRDTTFMLGSHSRPHILLLVLGSSTWGNITRHAQQNYRVLRVNHIASHRAGIAILGSFLVPKLARNSRIIALTDATSLQSTDLHV